jgi:hypothetical protein
MWITVLFSRLFEKIEYGSKPFLPILSCSHILNTKASLKFEGNYKES